MSYRESLKVRQRKARQREAIVAAATARIASGGYNNARMSEVAADAGIATGTLYRYFDSKAQLFAQVFRAAVGNEVQAVDAAAHGFGEPAERLQAVVHTFVERALRAPRLAYALLAEPVDPLVETERILFRQTYAGILQDVIRDGVASGEFADQEARVSAAALVGVLSETLVGPLSPWSGDKNTSPSGHPDQQALVSSISALCLRAVSHPQEVSS